MPDKNPSTYQPPVSIPLPKWVGEAVIMQIFSMTKTELNNYRQAQWVEKKHYRKVGTSGQYSHGKAKILYNINEITRWVDEYPVM